MKSIVLSVLAILAASVPSAVGAWWLMKSFGLTGAWLAITSAIAAMVFALALFVLMIAIGKKLGILKPKP
jgi:hypothetical protein